MQNVVAGLFIAVIAFLGYVAASNFARQRRQQLYLSRLPKLEADGIDPQTTDLSQAKILIKKAFEEVRIKSSWKEPQLTGSSTFNMACQFGWRIRSSQRDRCWSFR